MLRKGIAVAIIAFFVEINISPATSFILSGESNKPMFYNSISDK